MKRHRRRKASTRPAAAWHACEKTRRSHDVHNRKGVDKNLQARAGDHRHPRWRARLIPKMLKVPGLLASRRQGASRRRERTWKHSGQTGPHRRARLELILNRGHAACHLERGRAQGRPGHVAQSRRCPQDETGCVDERDSELHPLWTAASRDTPHSRGLEGMLASVPPAAAGKRRRRWWHIEVLLWWTM